ncbi:MAG: oxidoreductase FAD/NAD(P)-binding:oxidoreductase FAD-binding region [Pseudomonas sp.]|nr:oxidoreductase FAD/NAD(P)-binding:oxidoreductase FAD-binding region [Pseudomonas sp.]
MLERSGLEDLTIGAGSSPSKCHYKPPVFIEAALRDTKSSVFKLQEPRAHMTASAEKFTHQTLLNVTPLTPSLFTLRTTRDSGFRFRAGQFARLGVTKADGTVVWRAYSMVSSPHDEFLEFFSIVVPGGEFTSELSRLREGDTLLVDRQAFGYLTLDRFVDGRDLWMLSTGTGVAPFLSILQDFEVWEKFERIVLVYSVRETRELAYQQLIAELNERDYLADYAGKLLFLPTVTREQHPGALSGRITQLIESGELEQAAGLTLTPEHSRVMLCGNPQMIDDTRNMLKLRDLQLSLSRRPGQVAVETYW